MDEILEELKALRLEVAELRKDQVAEFGFAAASHKALTDRLEPLLTWAETKLNAVSKFAGIWGGHGNH